MKLPRSWVPIALGVLAVVAGVVFLFPEERPGTGGPLPQFSYEELTGSFFLPSPKEAFHAPAVRELSLPPTKNAQSIWGALGRDFRGHIWVGVSASGNGSSAHLLEFDPAAGSWHDRGGVVDRLKAAGVHRAGEGQVKIHSRIIPASDGWLYFASMDEEGENWRGNELPRWGGHLWRIHPQRHTWQHLAAVPESLVAVSGVGRYVYALGYWGHVLYQYDTATGAMQRVPVGSVSGHVSRNFLADARGHAYVPRLISEPDGALTAALVEYDSGLKELGATRLEFYLDKSRPAANHGIVGLAYLPNGRMLFATHIGYLYMIEPQGAMRATVTPVGWLHPNGKPAYVPSLFVLGGNTLVGGVAHRVGSFEWLVYNLDTGLSTAFPLNTGDLKGLLLYGSVSRDNDGRAYLGGWATSDTDRKQQRPVVLQIDPGR